MAREPIVTARLASCDCGARDRGWGMVWTGEWPGHAEVAEGLAKDLNDLDSKAMFGLLHWNGTRWVAKGS